MSVIPKHPLLVVSRRDILAAAREPGGQRLLRTLARLTRQGFPLLATASLSDEWSKSLAVSKRGRPGRTGLRESISSAGGTLNGVYYVPRSLMTQKTNREKSLQDMMDRFGAVPESCYLYSSSRKFVLAAQGLGINAHLITDKSPLDLQLRQLFERAC